MLRIRQIQTTTNAKGETIPALDAEGREIELSSIEIPREIEAQGGAAIDAYVAASPAERATMLAPSTPPDPAAADAAVEPVLEQPAAEPFPATTDDEEPIE